MKSKMTRMLEHLKKYPKQKYGQLQTTLYNLDTKKSNNLKKHHKVGTVLQLVQ